MKKKWGFSKLALNWWNNLSLSEQRFFKEKYEKVFDGETKFPSLKNTKNTRISKLTGNQIDCIFRFSDEYYTELEKFHKNNQLIKNDKI
jgi:hypothetical protein